MAHADTAQHAQHGEAGGHEEGQQHPLGLYLKVWLGLFVLSTLSYMVDYVNVQGELRWFLIIVFMWAKAALIVAIFMHMRWERLSLMLVILVPPLCLGVFVLLMSIEGDYTFLTRLFAFGS